MANTASETDTYKWAGSLFTYAQTEMTLRCFIIIPSLSVLQRNSRLRAPRDSNNRKSDNEINVNGPTRLDDLYALGAEPTTRI